MLLNALFTYNIYIIYITEIFIKEYQTMIKIIKLRFSSYHKNDPQMRRYR